MTKIDVISGFLGAGKTTFIQQLLKERKNENIVLIENEFGEIGVDSDFLQEAGIEIRELNSGCICCSLVGDFTEALAKVQQQYHPDMILIEPSGVGKLSEIQSAVFEASKQHSELVLGSSVVIVDVNKCKMYAKNFKEFYEDQVKHANVIVCSHVDVCSLDKMESTVKILREINEHAKIVTTDYHTLSANEIMELFHQNDEIDELAAHPHVEEKCACGHHHDEEHKHHHHDEECCCGHHHDEEHEHHHHDGECCCGHHHGHDADEEFVSWGAETARKYNKQELHDIITCIIDTEEFGTILRVKGMVQSDEGSWMYFDAIPGELNIKEGKPVYTGKICVIGKDMEQKQIAHLFRVA